MTPLLELISKNHREGQIPHPACVSHDPCVQMCLLGHGKCVILEAAGWRAGRECQQHWTVTDTSPANSCLPNLGEAEWQRLGA